MAARTFQLRHAINIASGTRHASREFPWETRKSVENVAVAWRVANERRGDPYETEDTVVVALR